MSLQARGTGISKVSKRIYRLVNIIYLIGLSE